MKNLRFIMPILIVVSVIPFFFMNNKDAQMSRAFEEMICSHDERTKLTAIILSAGLEDTQIKDVILKRLPNAEGVERVAIMYSLYMNDGNLDREFIDSIPVDEQGIRNLLKVESPLGSYFRAPYLRIIKAIGEISMHDDVALNKLKCIYAYSDGWQGDSILEMIMKAERRMGTDTDLVVDCPCKIVQILCTGINAARLFKDRYCWAWSMCTFQSFLT